MKKNIWIMTIAVLAVFGIGFAASDDSDNPEDPEKKSIVQKKQEFFEPGYMYSASYKVNALPGHGQEPTNESYKIKIYNDGTREIVASVTIANGKYEKRAPLKYSCTIEKRNESYRDISATYYHIQYQNGGIDVDEDGNIYNMSVCDCKKDKLEVISTRDKKHIVGKFSKTSLKTSETFTCKTCGEEYDPDKELIVSEEYCYLDYPQKCSYCNKSYTMRRDPDAYVEICGYCSAKKQAVDVFERTTGRSIYSIKPAY